MWISREWAVAARLGGKEVAAISQSRKPAREPGRTAEPSGGERQRPLRSGRCSLRSVPGRGRPVDAATQDLVGPDPEAGKDIRPERRTDGDVCGITAARDQYTADARLVVARVECVPVAA